MKRFHIIAVLLSILLALNSCSSDDSKESNNVENTTTNVEVSMLGKDSSKQYLEKNDKNDGKNNVKNNEKDVSSIMGTIISLLLTVLIALGFYKYRGIIVSKIRGKLNSLNRKKNGGAAVGSKGGVDIGCDKGFDKSESDLKPTPVLPTEPAPQPAPTPKPVTEPAAEPIPNSHSPKFSAFAEDDDLCNIVGASVQGNGHISMGLPCQDSCGYESIGDGWGIAITADGAGSAKNSQVGSAIAVKRAIFHFKNLINNERWLIENKFPSEIQWLKLSFKCLKLVHDDINAFAKKNNIDFKSLSSTIIVVIHSPLGLLTCHIGDGRAGYKDVEGNWHSLMIPHKGEEANQTIFIPSEFWNIPLYEMSGVLVPESRIIKEKVLGFVLMSDGCENTSWLCNQYNENTGKYFDPNLPYKPFFDNILSTLVSFREDKVSLDERKEKWVSFITSGNKSFVKEIDDKTMIVGALIS